MFGEVFLIIGGVEHALIFEALFRGCQHCVGERVSLRGAVYLYCMKQLLTNREFIPASIQ